MCGRARCHMTREEVASTSGIPQERWRDADRFRPDQNMSPGHWSPVVKLDKEGQLELHTMKWGLVPSFNKPGEKLDHFRMMNARSETVPEKSIFKRLLTRQRCVVLLNGFYEWDKDQKPKQPYYIYLEGDTTKMAGLFDCWHQEAEEPLYTFTILTTDASKRFSWLHDRMPVILHSKADEERWLSRSEIESLDYQRVCEPFNGEQLKWHAVTTAMNAVRYHGDDCSKEVKKGNIATFFKSKPGANKAGDVAKVHTPSDPNRPAHTQVEAEPSTTETNVTKGDVRPVNSDEPAAEQGSHQSQAAAPSPASPAAKKKREEATEVPPQARVKTESVRKRSGSQQQTSSPAKRQKAALPKGQGQISAFFSPK